MEVICLCMICLLISFIKIEKVSMKCSLLDDKWLIILFSTSYSDASMCSRCVPRFNLYLFINIQYLVLYFKGEAIVHDLSFLMLSFKKTFSLSSFIFIKRLFSSSSLSALGWCHLHIWGYWYFSQKSWLVRPGRP